MKKKKRNWIIGFVSLGLLVLVGILSLNHVLDDESTSNKQPNKTSEYQDELMEEVNKSIAIEYPYDPSSDFSFYVTRMADGTMSHMEVMKTIEDMGEFAGYQQDTEMTIGIKRVKAYTFTSKSGQPEEIISFIMDKGLDSDDAYRRVSIYYDSDTKEYRVAYLGVSFTYMSDWETD